MCIWLSRINSQLIKIGTNIEGNARAVFDVVGFDCMIVF